jgi:predicted membrane-bound dolichyl-phosphate-mannose-protein mannosyltransferase
VDDLHLFANIWGLFKNSGKIHFNENLKNGEDSLYVIENFVKSKQRMLLVNKPYYHYTVVEKSASELSPIERLVAHAKFLNEVKLLGDAYSRIFFLVKRHMLSDYFLVMCYMIDSNIDAENGLEYKKVLTIIKQLRAKGVSFPDKRDEIKYLLYRCGASKLVKLLKKIK